MTIVNAAGMPIASASSKTAPSADIECVLEGTEQTFMEDVINFSKTTPVLVDFWAPWCEPCKQYTPVIEKAVRAEKGRVRLVKVNVDENQSIAAQLGIRSLPTTMIFLQGQPMQALPGVIPAESLKKLLADLLRMTGSASSAEEIQALLDAATEALQTEDFALARQHYETILTADPAHIGATAGLLRAMIALQEAHEAEEFFAALENDLQQHDDVILAMQGLKLMGSGNSDTLKAALNALADAPNDPALQYQLAEAYLEANQKSDAVDTLLDIVAHSPDWNDKQAKQKLLEIFAALGFDDPLAKSGRQRLSSLLFT